MKYILIILFALTIVTSCQKSETASPITAPVDDTVFTREKLIGEWVVYLVKINSFKNDTFSYGQEWLRLTGYKQDNKLVKEWTSETDESYITFSADGSYMHTKPGGELNSYMLDDIWPAQGKWSFEGDTVRLTCFTTKGIKEAGWIYTYLNGAVSFALEDATTVGSAEAKYQTFVGLIQKKLIKKN